MIKLYLSKKHKEIVDKILKGEKDILVFGSRMKGGYTNLSDLDLCIKKKEAASIKKIALLKADFEDSSLPFTVDLIDYYRVDKNFQHIIDTTAIDWQKVTASL